MLSNSNEVKSPRNVYGETLVELGAKNPNIVVLDADLSCSTQTCKFAKAYPDRFFNCGIAEQDLMGTAAGLAYGGKIVFASTFAMFATARCLDQIRNTICYSKLDVKIVATHGGITVGEDGASHQALEDISYMRSIPDMKVIVPSDCSEVEQVIEYAANTPGPMYIRIPSKNSTTSSGKSRTLKLSKPIPSWEAPSSSLPSQAAPRSMHNCSAVPMPCTDARKMTRSTACSSRNCSTPPTACRRPLTMSSRSNQASRPSSAIYPKAP